MGRSPLARILRRRRTAALVAEHIVAIDVARVHMCGPLRNERLPHSMCPATTPHRNDFSATRVRCGGLPEALVWFESSWKAPGSAWRSQTARSGLQTRDAHLQMLLGCGALPGGLWGSALYGAVWFVTLFLGVAAGLCRKSASPDLELPRRPGLQTRDAHLQFLLGSEAPGRAPLYGLRGCFRRLLPVSVASCASLRSRIWMELPKRPGLQTRDAHLQFLLGSGASRPGSKPGMCALGL